jgi:hypothetical protein
MPALPPLDRRVAPAFVVAALLAVAGIALVLLAPPPRVLVPTVGDSSDTPFWLRYADTLPSAEATPLARPVGIAVDGGRIYVADSLAGVVRVFTSRGRDAGELGRGILGVPTYIATDPHDGSVLVSDRRERAVFRFARNGAFMGEFVPLVRSSDGTTMTPMPWEPLGLDIAEDSSVFVADVSGVHRVVTLTSDGVVTGALGSGEVTGSTVALDYPNVVRLRDDAVWVSDGNNRRVVVFDLTGGLRSVTPLDGVARGLDFIDLSVDGVVRSAAAVCDPLRSQVVLLGLDGAELARFGGPGAGPGQLSNPNDLAADTDAPRVYVADTAAARVQVWEVTDEPPTSGGAGLSSRVPPQRIAGIALLGLSLLPLIAGTYLASAGVRRRNISATADQQSP